MDNRNVPKNGLATNLKIKYIDLGLPTCFHSSIYIVIKNKTAFTKKNANIISELSVKKTFLLMSKIGFFARNKICKINKISIFAKNIVNSIKQINYTKDRVGEGQCR